MGSIFRCQKFSITSREPDDDYLLQCEKMSTFPGRHLSGRRNLVKQFNEHYPDHKTIEWASHILEIAFKFSMNWCEHAPLHAQLADCEEPVKL